jgi:hypothetical protein
MTTLALAPMTTPGTVRTTNVARPVALIGIGLAALLAGGCGGDGGSDEPSHPSAVPQPTRAQLAAAGLAELTLAPERERVDLTAPRFSDPTDVTNPLFPISDLRSAVLSGRVEGKPFHTETTLLPETRIIEWAEGEPVETLVSQYVAYLGGRIEEVALDYYAQADDGSVWYFGEDVFNYNENGEIADTEGTWLAGKDGSPAMIMPAHPHVGDVYRTETIPGLAFEQVTVKTTDKTVQGPSGPVEGAMVGEELHDDGSLEDKVFGPGYGEFFTGGGGDVEAMALAVPTDAVAGPPPAALGTISSGADRAFDAIRTESWRAASAAGAATKAAWDAYRGDDVPPRLAPEMSRAVAALAAAIDARDRARAGTAAIDVAQSALDLKLRYRPPAEIDLARFELWTRQILVDALAGDLVGVRGDLATLEWIRDRFREILASADLTRIDARLLTLREAVVDEDLGAATAEAQRLRGTLATTHH